jgi:hypothetical protein
MLESTWARVDMVLNTFLGQTRIALPDSSVSEGEGWR